MVNFETVESVRCNLSNAVLGKMNDRSRDTSIAGDIAFLARNYDAFRKGTLLLPLSEKDQMFQCSVSCGGLSAERDDIPHWVTPVNAEILKLKHKVVLKQNSIFLHADQDMLRREILLFLQRECKSIWYHQTPCGVSKVQGQ